MRWCVRHRGVWNKKETPGTAQGLLYEVLRGLSARGLREILQLLLQQLPL